MKKSNFQKIIYFSAPHPAKIFIPFAYDSPLVSLTSLKVSYFYLPHTPRNKLFTVKNQKIQKYIFFSENDIFSIVKTEKKILATLDKI